MNEDIAQSAFADRLRIPAHVVIHRAVTTPKGLAEIRSAGRYEPGSEGVVCELVAGGAVIATGKLVRKSGSWCLQIEETAEAT